MDNKITALIPTYQRPQFLRRAILSVLNQTYKNCQVAVFDNASNDNTENVVDDLKKTDSRIIYHCHEKNIGALANFRCAFESVDTPYFSVLSDDDALVGDFYENAIQILDYYPDIMFVVLNILVIDENANLFGCRESTNTLKFYRGNEKFSITSSDAISSTWTATVFRKEVAKIYCDMQDKYDIASDIRFLMLARAKYNFAYLSKVGAFFTFHANSTSAQRPYFDLVHHAVQISRHIEIYYDNMACQLAKDQAHLAIKSMLSFSIKQNFRAFFGVMKYAIKKICDKSDLNEAIIRNEVENAKRAGFNITAFFLRLTYTNKIVKYIIRTFFSPYYTKHKMHHMMDMLELQNGTYKKIFETLKALQT